MQNENRINVTKPFLPPLEEFIPYLEQIWENKWLTNNGPLHQQLEEAMAKYLEVSYVSLFANGTLALMTALQALDIEGEVITTPYSFVATSHALLWNKLTPVFVDIDPIYGNLDPEKIEAAITDKTAAILPVHVYGHPCDVRIDTIAKKHNLKLIYDAAHAFGVKQNGNSVLNRGDLSILSFHATKVFNTFEGGAIICNTLEMKQHLNDLKNFGFRGETSVILPGINAKMSEVNAAMGLLQLNYIDENIAKRKAIVVNYKDSLKEIKGIRFLQEHADVDYNCSYFPIFIEEEYAFTRDEIYETLKENGIFGRRYFYPLISDFETYEHFSSARKDNLITAHRLSNQVICLPLYPELDFEIVDRIINRLKTR